MVEQIVKSIPSKGTRMSWALFFGITASIWWFLSAICLLKGWATADEVKLVGFTTENWIAAITGNLVIYAASETVVKGAEAHMNRDV